MSGTALLFPGQGSQYVGMGSDLAEDDASTRELFELADDLLSAPLSRICREGPEERLRATENAQPAIMLHSYAVWRLVEDSVSPVGAGAGHSLGEFSAHLASGTFEFEDALALVRIRGKLMAAAGSGRPGAMAAILGLDADAVGEACERASRPPRRVVVPANLNAPRQVVISGDAEAVAAAGRLASEAGARRVVPLNVSGAFHSPLMEPASNGLAEALDDTRMTDPSFPVISNAEADIVTSAVAARRTLAKQLVSPVRWAESMTRIGESGATRILEIGPGSVLSGLARRIDRTLRVTPVGSSASVNALLGSSA